MRTERNVEQETKLEQFFSTYYSIKDWDKAGNTIGAVAIAVIIGGLMGIPIQNFMPDGLEKDDVLFISIFAVMAMTAAVIYLKSYSFFQENKNVYSFDDKLKYLPVDKEALKSIRMQHLFRFESRFYLASLAMQLFFTVIYYHRITWMNIIYVTVVIFLIPMLTGMLDIWTRDRS